MCRMLAIRSAHPVSIDDLILDAPRSLSQLSREHCHGWGLAAYEGNEPKVTRGTLPAWEDPTFEQIGRTLGGHLISSSDDFSLALLEQGKVAVVSCTAFGTTGFCRLTYADSLENIKEGLDRIEKFVKG